MAEGRQPWSPEQLAQPQAELADHESGISALAASPHGDAAVAGTEQGTVALWDLRSSALTSQASPAAAGCLPAVCCCEQHCDGGMLA